MNGAARAIHYISGCRSPVLPAVLCRRPTAPPCYDDASISVGMS